MILFCDFSKNESKQKLYDNLKKLDKSYRIEIVRDRDNRSNRQNKYYWGVIIKMISDYTGFFPDEVHEILKGKFLSYEKVITHTGQEVTLSMSTAELDKYDFEQYLEKCRIFAAGELDLIIPLPNECLEI